MREMLFCILLHLRWMTEMISERQEKGVLSVYVICLVTFDMNPFEGITYRPKGSLGMGTHLPEGKLTFYLLTGFTLLSFVKGASSFIAF